jgi:hypothetical protein
VLPALTEWRRVCDHPGRAPADRAAGVDSQTIEDFNKPAWYDRKSREQNITVFYFVNWHGIYVAAATAYSYLLVEI